MTETFEPSLLSWTEALVRIGAATLLPLAIGLERYFHRKPIDFRPFVIISVASCAAVIGALELVAATVASQAQLDPIRVIEGVITGIGFLGAGAMFRRGNFVQGAGSAAAIWCAGVLGVLCGIGVIWLAGITAALVVALLFASRPFTEKWDPDSRSE